MAVIWEIPAEPVDDGLEVTMERGSSALLRHPFARLAIASGGFVVVLSAACGDRSSAGGSDENFQISSATCTRQPGTSPVGAAYRVTANGTASGPVGAALRVGSRPHRFDHTLSCRAGTQGWSTGSTFQCERRTGDPETISWSVDGFMLVFSDTPPSKLLAEVVENVSPFKLIKRTERSLSCQ